jgi:hypothetical protein
MQKLTLVKNPTPANSVQSHFPEQKAYEYIPEFTLERDPTTATSVRSHFIILLAGTPI